MLKNLNYKIVPFFGSNKKPVTVAGTSESFYNNGYDSLILEVNGVAVGRIEGCIDVIKADESPKADEDCAWSSLALIDMKDYSLKQGFDAAGKYVIGINGMQRIRVVLTSVTGETTIIGVVEE